MAREHLVCEHCAAEFSSTEDYLAHQRSEHARAHREAERRLDEEVEETFPASDPPASTNPSVRVGEVEEDAAGGAS